MNKMDAIIAKAKTSGPRLVVATPTTDAAGEVLMALRDLVSAKIGLGVSPEITRAQAAIARAEGRAP